MRDYSQVSLLSRGSNAPINFTGPVPQFGPAQTVMIMGKRISSAHHPTVVRIASQNQQPPKRTDWLRQACEDAVAAQETIATEGSGQKARPQAFRFDHRDRKEAIFTVGVQDQAWGQ